MCSIFSTVAKQPLWKMDTEHDYALRRRDIIHSFLPLQSKYSTSQYIELRLTCVSKMLEWNFYFKAEFFYAMARECFCRTNFLNKLQVDARH